MTEAEELEAKLIDAAWRAAPRFDLDPSNVSILNRSENVVCAVTRRDGSKVALRLHRPGYNSTDELRSEVQWVLALAAAGIPVPNPVAAVGGGHYSPIDVHLAHGSTEHQVGVIEWVEGQPLGDPLTAGGQDLSAHYERIGELAAQVRLQSQDWTPPPGFVRRRWDADSFVGTDPLWGRFWEVAALTADQRDLLAAARDAMHAELASQPTTSDRFGLIHADLHLGNVMADGQDLTLIDFDDAGFGWYAYELAVSLHNALDEPWYLDARAAMFDGYRRFHPLAEDEVRLVDTLLTMRSLMIVGWLAARPELPAYEELPGLIDYAVNAATEFLNPRGLQAHPD